MECFHNQSYDGFLLIETAGSKKSSQFLQTERKWFCILADITVTFFKCSGQIRNCLYQFFSGFHVPELLQPVLFDGVVHKRKTAILKHDVLQYVDSKSKIVGNMLD